MAEVTFGPKGTTLIQVGNTFYLAYDNGASILYWELSKGVDLSTITNINPSFVNQFDSQGKLIAGKDIEGYMYINQDDWDLQIVEGDRLVKAGTILEIVDDGTNITAWRVKDNEIQNKVKHKSGVTEWLTVQYLILPMKAKYIFKKVAEE